MRRNILSAPIHKIDGESISQEQDLIAVEEPLQICIGERDIAITMRTPGNDVELAAGFLFTEGILKHREDIAAIQCSPNRVKLTLGADAQVDLDRLERHFYTTSSCGVCGKASIESLHASGCPVLSQETSLFEREVIHRLPEKLRSTQTVFDHTGGLHAAGLFDAQGEQKIVREDVGRHNAVDKLIGAALLEGLMPLGGHILMVSSRASFELVQKALMASIPVLAAVGAPSSLAIETAMRFGMTLLGFVREHRFNVYSGLNRFR